jgi:hypothetical protein
VRGRLEYGNSRWQEEAGESKFDVRSSFTKETLHIRHEIIQKKNQRTICYIYVYGHHFSIYPDRKIIKTATQERNLNVVIEKIKKIKIKTDEKITDGRKLHYFFSEGGGG